MRTFDPKKKATQQTVSVQLPPRRPLFGQRHELNPILHFQRLIGNQAMLRLVEARSADTSPAIRRRCAECKGGGNKTIQAKRMPPAHADAALDAGAGVPAFEHAGERLPKEVRNFFEPRFGRDFSGIRVHTGPAAAESARSANAIAYTAGRDIVFGANRYAPSTPDGKRLLAHELAHSVQQAGGIVAPGLNRPDDAHERIADEVAARVLARGDTGALLPHASPAHNATQAAIQRQYSGSSSATSDPDALIPVADFISYVESVERKYASDTPEDIVTRIRQEYYSGLAFETLIPDARYRRLAPIYAQPPAGGMPIYYPSNLSDMRWDTATSSAYEHLTAHADENAIGDNPSPYIVMPDNSRIDVGHMLLGLDSLLHPRVGQPYSAYGIPGIDPASWAADLALASYWTTYHDRNGSPADDAAVKPATADFDAYYNASAPNEDLLGDADSFGTFQQWSAQSGQTLSQVLTAYYLGSSGVAAGVNRRWRTFCAANGLGYTISGGTVTWDTTLETAWEPRISRLCDLFDSGTASRIGSMTFGTAPDPGVWPYSLPALRRFLDWLKPRLEAEISAHP